MKSGLNTLYAICLLIFFSACSEKERADAYGQFEAKDLLISAETAGVLENFEVEEGI